MGGMSIVTGASSGIGEAVVDRLVGRGDQVLAIARDPGKLEALARRHPAGRVDAAALDVADRNALEARLRDVATPHTLVLSAGICEQARVDEPDADEVWFRALDINLHGVYFAIKAVVPRMVQGGRIVVVSSGLGKLGRAGYAAYCASKHAVLGVVKCVAKELAPRGITVNAVCPGWVDTPMARADVTKTARERGTSEDEVLRGTQAAIPTGRWVSADECAALIAWLASPEAASVTGEAYNISGGEFFA